MRLSVQNEGIWKLGYHWFGRLPVIRNHFSTRTFWLIVHFGPYTLYVWR